MKSGVYEIVCETTGKRYVGSAVDFTRRWNKHRRELAGGDHHSRKLQNCWRKYGPENFTFRKLVICKPEHAVMYEQIALDALRPELNIAMQAGSTLGVKHSEDARARHSAASRGRKHSEETRMKLAEVQRGRKHPPEFGAAIAERNRGISRPKSEEHRRKISAALVGHSFNAGIKKSEEHKAKLSTQRRGVSNPKNLGNRSRTGMQTDPAIVAKQVAGLKAYWERRKAAA